jgi:molybdopterin-guanine dinucleotide biosynthesis adapter protein
MKVFGVIGWKNAGKTSLMERLVAEITARGVSVSTVKHVHHEVDLDQPGKDSYRHRAAGAREVILASAHRFAVMVEHRGPEPSLEAVLARLAPVDLVLVEGYKRDAHPKIEVFRAEAGHELIQPGDPTVQAVATDAGLSDLTVPVLDLNDTQAVADFVLRSTGIAPDFDTVAIVDWSASSVPSPARPSRDAIWIGLCRNKAAEASYYRTRAAAESALENLIAAERAAGRRLLIGFDFPMGYPAGFAGRITGENDTPRGSKMAQITPITALRLLPGSTGCSDLKDRSGGDRQRLQRQDCLRPSRWTTPPFACLNGARSKGLSPQPARSGSFTPRVRSARRP